MSYEKQAKGYIKETLGNDIDGEINANKDETGTYFTFDAFCLGEERLETLKRRFEVVQVMPSDKKKHFEVEVKRRK